MCGICGFTGKGNNIKRITAFKALLVANQSRGDDSTGIYLHDSQLVHKKAIDAVKFVPTLNNELLATQQTIIGHTRLATTGKVSDDNSHPFTFGNITGIHNGMVQNYFAVYPDATVDSESIFYQLNKSGNNYKKALKKLSGSFAIAWLQHGNENLYLVRQDNPLSVAIVDNTLFFNSEYYPLISILYAVYGNVDKAYELEPEQVYTIDKNLNIKTKKIKFKDKYQYTTAGYTHGYNWRSDDYDDDLQLTGYADRELEMIHDTIAMQGCVYCLDHHFRSGWYDYDTDTVVCDRCYEYAIAGNYIDTSCLEHFVDK